MASSPPLLDSAACSFGVVLLAGDSMTAGVGLDTWVGDVRRGGFMETERSGTSKAFVMFARGLKEGVMLRYRQSVMKRI